MSNMLEAINKLKHKNRKNHFSNLVLYLPAYSLYRHMKLHSKQPVKQAAL